MPDASAVVSAVKAQDLGKLERALAQAGGRVPATAVLAAAQQAWKPGLVQLKRHGGDLNAIYRNYRPLHALIQEVPHGESPANPQRVACLAWLLKNGADPELTGAWPAARAIVVAAFQ